MRLDNYLKVSRIIKRRTVANEVCDAERVSVNGRVARASYNVQIGDIVEIRMGDGVTRFEVTSVQENQAKDMAKTMYRML